MDLNFNFEYPKENYPIEFQELRRMKFIEICKTILYSDDEHKIQNAYNLIFTEYRRSIINGDFSVSVSLFEDVILKILNDADNDLYEKYGVQNSPFLRFVALIKEQEDMFTSSKTRQVGSLHFINLKAKSKKETRLVLKTYLLMFIDGHKNVIRNNYIRRLIHQYFSSI